MPSTRKRLKQARRALPAPRDNLVVLALIASAAALIELAAACAEIARRFTLPEHIIESLLRKFNRASRA